MAEQATELKLCPTCQQSLKEKGDKVSMKIQELEIENGRLTQELEEKARKIDELENLLQLGKLYPNEEKCKKKRSLKRLKTDNSAMRKEISRKGHQHACGVHRKSSTAVKVEEQCVAEPISQHTRFKSDDIEFVRTLLSKLDKDCESFKKESEEAFQKFLGLTSKLEQQNAAVLERLDHTLRERATKCQKDAEMCQLIERDRTWLKSEHKRLLERETQYGDYVSKLRQQRDEWKQKAHSAQLSHQECPTCSDLHKKVKKLEHLLSQRNENRKPPDLEEGLQMEYEKLVKGYDVLQQVESHFKDGFDAKWFISEIFMDAYDKCRMWLMNILCTNIDELFKVQNEEHRFSAMEDLSHAFGLLLQTAGVKLMIAKNQTLPQITKQVEECVPKLESAKRVKGDLKSITKGVPLDRFVQLAWKFVTQPYPVIISTPKTTQYDESQHRQSYYHWKEEAAGKQKLLYAQPVVYRSYHGNVLVKGLVGNVH